MNIITIDPSLSCTAVNVNDKKFAFVNNKLLFTSKGEYAKWFKLTSPYVTFFGIEYDTKLKDFSANELNKLKIYNETTDLIVDTVMTNVDPELDLNVFIEGYSFSSNAGPLVDLVTFGTLLRHKLYAIIEYVDIIPPTSLKLEAAKLTYPAISKGKKVIKYEYRNNSGLAGGSFKKPDMYRALIDNNNLQTDYVKFLRTVSDEILNNKQVPKPIEDINDAQLMYFIAHNR